MTPVRAFHVAILLAILFAACARSGGDAVDLRGEASPRAALWLDSLDLGQMTTGRGRARAGQTIDGNPLRIGGVAFARGIGTHTASELLADLHGEAVRFIAEVGVDDQAACLEERSMPIGTARFRVFADGNQLADSGALKLRDPPKRIEVDLTGAHSLRLVVDGEGGDVPVDWAGAVIVMRASGSPPPEARPPEASAIGHVPEAAATPSRVFTPDETKWVETGRGPEDGAWLETLEKVGGTRLPDAITFQRTPDWQPLSLGLRRYGRGFGVAGDGEVNVALAGQVQRLYARVGVDRGFSCAKTWPGAGARFSVLVDGREAFDSGPRRPEDEPMDVWVDLSRAQRLSLITRTTDPERPLNADWVGTVLVRDSVALIRPTLLVPQRPVAGGAASQPSPIH